MLSELLAYDIRIARLAVLTVFLLCPSIAEGRQEWTCKKMNMTRRLTIDTIEYGRSPCRVIYAKPDENVPPREIGAARRDFSFCERTAEELALKLQNMDWECEREDS